MPGWEQGKGWGWIWGADDEIGALNAQTPQSIASAMQLARSGTVYDLGVPVDRRSFLAPVHPHTEVLSFRTPENAKRQNDIDVLDPVTNTAELSFMSDLVMISDHAGTQIDGLGHITAGPDDHWYNGFTFDKWGGDFGPRRASADTTPPIIARGVLLDVAGSKGVQHLGDRYPISAADLQAAVKAPIRPGDVVCVRTGSLSLWGEAGLDHEALRGPDASGLTLEAARWLVEEHGAMVVCSDTSMVEVFPAVDGKSWHPVHEYLLIEQGVHMGELFFLEELARDGVEEFCFIALLPKLRGLTGGFAMRPVAVI